VPMTTASVAGRESGLVSDTEGSSGMCRIVGGGPG
jgi:hypothetical protein